MVLKFSEERFLIQMISFVAILLILLGTILMTSRYNDIVWIFSVYLLIVFFGVELWRIVDVFKDGIERYWTYLRPPHPEINAQLSDVGSLISFIGTLLPERENVEFTEVAPESLKSSFLVGFTLLLTGVFLFLVLGLAFAGLEELNLIEDLLPTDQSRVSTSFATLAVLLGRVLA